MEIISRASAIRQGLSFYFTGKPCREGHVAKRYLTGNCARCDVIRARAYKKKNPLQHLLSCARYRAKRDGLPFALRLEDLVVPQRCPVLGIPLILGGSISPGSVSLDRFDNSKGYTADNTRIISTRANVLKSNASLRELEAVVAYMRGGPPEASNIRP